MLAPLTMGSLHIVASASVIDLDPKRASYLAEVKQEKNLVTVDQDARGAYVKIDADDYKVDFKRKRGTAGSHLKVEADGVNLQFSGTFNDEHESMFWSTPMTDDKLTTFFTWKRSGIPLVKCDYTFEGKSYSLDKGQCMITTDQYRGHHNYGMAFHFGIVQGRTASGSTYALIV